MLKRTTPDTGQKGGQARADDLRQGDAAGAGRRRAGCAPTARAPVIQPACLGPGRWMIRCGGVAAATDHPKKNTHKGTAAHATLAGDRLGRTVHHEAVLCMLNTGLHRVHRSCAPAHSLPQSPKNVAWFHGSNVPVRNATHHMSTHLSPTPRRHSARRGPWRPPSQRQEGTGCCSR